MIAHVNFTIDGEAPFATPCQTFLTSTGLRAVDPKAAMATNPFLSVGKLAVGHVIYRRHGEGYEYIEIYSIEKTRVEEETVYSVFPQVSQKYYHANGYLVSQNMPEHTLQIAADSLRKVSDSERLSLLSNFTELYALFGKYDRKTIKARLDLELLNEYHEPRFNKWGALGMTEPPQVGGTGGIKLVSPAKQKNKSVPLDQIRRTYELIAHHPNRIGGHYRLPSIDVIDGCVVVGGEVQLRSSYNLESRTFKWTREIANTNSFEHGMLRIYQDGLTGDGTIFVTTELNPTQVDNNGLYTFTIRAKPVLEAQKQGSTLDDGKGYVGLDKYNLTVDRTEWLPDTDRGEVQDPIDMGEFTYGYSDEGDTTYVQYAQYALLNELGESINRKFDKSLDELYKVECTTLEDNTFRATVRFHRASTVPLISDSGDDVRTFNVKFPGLGLDLTLPVLFQEFYIDIDVFDDFSYGALYEFDPDMRGGKGTRQVALAYYT